MATLAGALLNSQNGGRIFAAPQSQLSSGKAELWVNLGAPFSDTVQHVPYCVALQPAYSKEKYDDLMGELLKLLVAEYPKRPTTDGCCAKCCGCAAKVCAPCICIGSCLCCCCLPCFAACCGACAVGAMTHDMVQLANKINAATEKGQKLVEGKAGGTASLKVVGVGEDPVVLKDGSAAVDQRGEPLTGLVDDGDLPARNIWPPQGVSLVFTFPAGVHLTGKWPPSPNQAQMIGN